MYLRSLRLVGFKSFARPTEILFAPGTTAVVGPNGSGKTNLADAVRWVLGEQSSRSLRTSRLQDVIFAGSESRRPLGYAEISLTLDNTSNRLPVDFTEVTVTRRVYRSGESEYLINGVPSRLRDIQELFLDTGLGRGGLALVGQGEVDAVLSARPEDRRALIEEAAGISRYRLRRRDSLRELETARQDLARVEDLLGELAARRQALEAQAYAAAAYRALRDRVRVLEERVARRAYQAAQSRVARAREVLAERARAAEKAQGRVSEAERALAEAASRRAVRQREVEEAAARAGEARERRAEWQHRLALLRQEESHAGVEARRAQEDLASWEDRLRAAQEEEREVRARLERLAATVAAARERLAGREQDLAGLERDLAREQQGTEAVRERVGAARAAVAACQAEQGRLEREAASLAERRHRLEEQRGRWHEEQQAAASRAEELAAGHEQARADLARAREEVRGAAARLEAAEGAAARAGAELATRQEEAGKARARLRTLEELEREGAGLGEGARAVLASEEGRALRAADGTPGILGAVGSLLTAPPGLETALEAALGASQQFVVTATEKEAAAAIEYLKRTRAGRATFLPLAALRPRPWPQEAAWLWQEKGVIGRAADLARAERALQPLLEHLLGRVAVVSDLRRALALARRLPAGVRVVTRAGELIQPGGAITGGTPSRSAPGLLRRRREREELEAALRGLDQELAGLRRAAQDAQGTLAAARSRQERARADAAEAEVRVARLGAELAAARDELASLARRGSELAAASQELEQAGRELAQALEDSRARGEEARLRLRALESETRTVGERLAALEGRVRRGRQAVTEARVALASVEQEEQALARDLARLVASGQAAGQGAARARQEAEAALARARAAAAQHQELEARRDELEQAVGRAGHALAEAETALTAARAEQERREEDARRARAEADTRAAARHEADLELARAHTALEAARARLEELGVDPAGPGPEPGPAADGRSLDELRRELDAFGPVNLAAPQELAELSERVAFLEAQRADLLEGAARLEEAVAAMDRTSRERFLETLTRVGEAFSDLFQRLFGGGRARLVLTAGEEDPLSGGVNVVVQLPGRRPQDLLALSGGERSLTALALLFALLRVRPSPFCVLDEVDAALDEVNLGRFVGLLRDFCREVQFIVITHRAATMDAAEALYGVTMEEAGVSALVSVRLPQAS